MTALHVARSAINAALSRTYHKPVQKAATAPAVVVDEPMLDSAVTAVDETAAIDALSPVVAATDPSESAAADAAVAADVVLDSAAEVVVDATLVIVNGEPLVAETPVLDSTAQPEAVEPVAAEPVVEAAPVVTLDDASEDDIDPAASYSEAALAIAAAATIQEWVETDPALLDEGETLADRLLMMFVGVADQDQNGELDEDETAVLEAVLDYAWSYLATKGVTDEDASALLNDWDDTVAMRVRDLVASALPEGDEAAADEIDDFVFGDNDQSAVFDAVYKKKLVIRDGKKVRINKRVSGTIRLTSAQKVGIRKAQMKSHNATAVMRRSKSLRKSRAMGLTK